MQLAEHQQANSHRGNGAKNAGNPGVGAGNVAVHHQVAEQVDVVVQRVQLHQFLQGFRQGGDGVEQRGGVHPTHGKDTVQVHHITEIHRQRGKQQPQPATEKEEQHQRQPAQKDGPIEGGTGKDHDQQNRTKAEQHGDKAGNRLADGEDELGNVHLFDQRGVLDNRSQAHAGGLIEKGKQGVAADQVKREVWDIVAEHVRKDDALQQHHQQRVQNAPDVTQKAAAVFDFQIAADKFMDQRLVFFQVGPGALRGDLHCFGHVWLPPDLWPA